MLRKKLRIFTLTVGFLLNGGLTHAKDKGSPVSLAVPGELRSTGGGAQIFLESGRSLFWPSQGPLLLRDPMVRYWRRSS